MTTPPKTMAEIRDAACAEYFLPENCPRELGWNNKLSFKAGFDCAYNESEKLTRVTNEALKIAVEALEFIETDLDITHVKAALAEIRRLRGEG